MARITFITKEEDSIIAEGVSGSVMELAVANNVKGIGGDCGVVCSCGTCHVYVTADFMDKIEKQGEIKKDTLEFENNTNMYSRLSCQIKVSEVRDGIVLKVAG